jgi:hypothetical protein
MAKKPRQHSVRDVAEVQQYIDDHVEALLFPPSGTRHVIVKRNFTSVHAHGSIQVPSSGPAHLYLARDFFRQTPVEQADTLIHECCHVLFLQHDEIFDAWAVGAVPEQLGGQFAATCAAAEHSVIRRLTEALSFHIRLPEFTATKEHLRTK